ncbi:hypothetical protein HK099_007401 [Clydaea vesicula]|uniref:Kelch repeat-containing protein n=1 Tax=Clydaea vesicula TaxID=447962 RepID=A0AAD5TX55_9FUNG|nr:hypothetical protein HK099_007401 [Clydaea vesicula]KAJ3386151.1 hypothetical protein HDU92_002658 [Lobulomyces angularis]
MKVPKILTLLYSFSSVASETATSTSTSTTLTNNNFTNTTASNNSTTEIEPFFLQSTFLSSFNKLNDTHYLILGGRKQEVNSSAFDALFKSNATLYHSSFLDSSSKFKLIIPNNTDNNNDILKKNDEEKNNLYLNYLTGHKTVILNSNYSLVLFGSRKFSTNVFVNDLVPNTVSVFDNVNLISFPLDIPPQPERIHHMAFFNPINVSESTATQRVFVIGGVTKINSKLPKFSTLSQLGEVQYSIRYLDINQPLINDTEKNKMQPLINWPLSGNWTTIHPDLSYSNAGLVGSCGAMVDSLIIYCFGSTFENNVHQLKSGCSIFDTVTLKYIKHVENSKEVPEPREGATLVYVKARNALFLFGGVEFKTKRFMNDIWILNVALLVSESIIQWGRVSSISANVTSNETAISNSFGGVIQNNTLLHNSTENAPESFVNNEGPPEPRAFHGSDVWKNNYIIFWGGLSDKGHDMSIRLFNTSDLTFLNKNFQPFQLNEQNIPLTVAIATVSAIGVALVTSLFVICFLMSSKILRGKYFSNNSALHGKNRRKYYKSEDEFELVSRNKDLQRCNVEPKILGMCEDEEEDSASEYHSGVPLKSDSRHQHQQCSNSETSQTLSSENSFIAEKSSCSAHDNLPIVVSTPVNSSKKKGRFQIITEEKDKLPIPLKVGRFQVEKSPINDKNPFSDSFEVVGLSSPPLPAQDSPFHIHNQQNQLKNQKKLSTASQEDFKRKNFSINSISSFSDDGYGTLSHGSLTNSSVKSNFINTDS